MKTDAQWYELLSRSHEVVVKAEIWHNGRISPSKAIVLGGKVDVDGSASIRRKMDMELRIRKGHLLPTTPGVTEIRLWRGLMHRGEEKLWPLGQFRISDDDVNLTTDDLTYRVAGYDISRTLTLNQLYYPLSIPAGTPVEQAIEALLSRALTGLSFVWPENSVGTVPAMLFEDGEEPWPAAQKLAAQFGCNLYVDPLGRIVLEEPSPLDVGGIQILSGRKLFGISNSRNDEPGYNGVKLISEPEEAAPVWAYAFDDNPDSDTYWLGPYGARFRFMKTRFVMSQAQADAAVIRHYERSLGGTNQAKYRTFVDPTLEAFDVRAIEAPDVNIADRFRVEAFTIPLDVESDMDVTAAKRRGSQIATELPDEL